MDLRTALIACTASLILGLAGGAYGCHFVYEKDALEASIALDAAKRESEELRKAADALQEQAGIALGAADTYAKAAADAESKVKALKAKLASLQPVSPIPSVPDPVGNVVPDPVDVLKDEIIAAQDIQIVGLKGEVSELRASLELKGQALITSERRARGLEIALETQKRTATAGKWTGRLQGLVLGLGTSYIAQRLP